MSVQCLMVRCGTVCTIDVDGMAFIDISMDLYCVHQICVWARTRIVHAFVWCAQCSQQERHFAFYPIDENQPFQCAICCWCFHLKCMLYLAHFSLEYLEAKLLHQHSALGMQQWRWQLKSRSSVYLLLSVHVSLRNIITVCCVHRAHTLCLSLLLLLLLFVFLWFFTVFTCAQLQPIVLNIFFCVFSFSFLNLFLQWWFAMYFWSWSIIFYRLQCISDWKQ